MKSLILLISFVQVIKISFEEKVIFAWQINRHGARAPYSGVKNGVDIYKENWTQIEELSDVGKRMLYLLGVKARKRYIEHFHLLNETYNPQEIYIRSTDVNRTIESIESYLQGLYPAGTGPTINKILLDKPEIINPPNENYTEYFEEVIERYNLNDNGSALPYQMSVEPIHLFYKPDHEFQLYDSNLCKGHKELYEGRKLSQEVQDFGLNLYKEYPYFSELENTNNETFLADYSAIYKYTDGFICDYVDQRNFNYLKEKYGFNETSKEKLLNYSLDFLWMDYSAINYPEGHEEIPIMSMSYTMHSILNWMENAIKGYKSKKTYIKFAIYSAHDSSIGALEHFMKYVFDLKVEYSTFAEARFFELFLDDNNDYYVRYLRGDGSEKINMTFDEFKEAMDLRTWNDSKVANFCQFEYKEGEPTYYDNDIDDLDDDEDKDKGKDDNKEDDDEDDDKKHIYISSMVIMSIINFILIIILILICFKK